MPPFTQDAMGDTFAGDISQLVFNALEDLGLSSKLMARSTNMFALGLLYWLLADLSQQLEAQGILSAPSLLFKGEAYLGYGHLPQIESIMDLELKRPPE